MTDFLHAQARYAARLSRALELVCAQLPIEGLNLTKINDEALESYQRHWEEREDRRVGWDWCDDEFHQPKGFQVAIWHNDKLCGLASGRLASGKAVRIDFIEAFPGDNALRDRVILLALTCAEAYCKQIGSKTLKLNGVIPPLVKRYESYGFELASESRNDHVVMRRAVP